jgi:LacI family transcriptional regulator
MDARDEAVSGNRAVSGKGTVANRPTIYEVAESAGVSPATVHRALRGYTTVTAATRDRVLKAAAAVGFKPNRAASSLSSKRPLRISVNTISPATNRLKGPTNFWNEVRAGIEEERASLDIQNVEIESRTYPRLDASETNAFKAALKAGVDGIIAFPGNAEALGPLLKRAQESNVPVVMVATDAPGTGRLAVSKIDASASGALAADLMGRFVHRPGTLGVTLFNESIREHARKYASFVQTIRTLHPALRVEAPITDQDQYQRAYDECAALIRRRSDLAGIYVTTENSLPVIAAVRDAGLIGEVTIITTDLFPALVTHVRSGTVAASIFQRPRTQGRTAFRLLYNYLSDRTSPVRDVTFAPHLVMRGNLEFFLRGEHSPNGKASQSAEIPLDPD